MRFSALIGMLVMTVCAKTDSTAHGKERIVLPLKMGPVGDPAHFKSLIATAIPLSVISLWQFYVELQVGSPAQNISLVIDTSIRETFIPSTACLSTGCLPMLPNAFNPGLSTTLQISQDRFKLSVNDYNYAFNKVIGNRTLEVFTIGSIAFLADFLLVDETDPLQVSTVLYNGRLGLGRASQDDPLSLLPSIFQTGLSQIISWYFFPFDGYGIVGGLEIGDVNYDLVEMDTWQTFSSIDLGNGNRQWALPVSNIGANGQSLGYNGYALIDTSTPLIVGSLPLVNTLNAMIGFAQQGGTLISAGSDTSSMTYQIPCNASALLPDVDLTIAGVAYTIPPSSYLIGDGITCVSVFHGVQGASSWVLGMSMFKGAMVALDYEAGTISFGVLSPLPGP